MSPQSSTQANPPPHNHHQGFVHGITQLLHNKLAGRSDLLSAAVIKAHRRNSRAARSGEGADDQCAMDLMSTTSDSSEVRNQGMPQSAGTPTASATPTAGATPTGAQLRSDSPSSSNREGQGLSGLVMTHASSSKCLNIEAMLKVGVC